MGFKFRWATDDDHPAGSDAWSGQDNKVAPSSGRRDEGYPPELQMPAEHFNYLLNEIGDYIDKLYGLTVFNFSEAQEFVGIGSTWASATVTIGQAAYCPFFENFEAIDNRGNTVYTEDRSFATGIVNGGHVSWQNEATTPISVWGQQSGTGTNAKILQDIGGSTRLAILDTADDLIAVSSARDVWASTLTNTTGVEWKGLAHGPTDLVEEWAIGANDGTIETSQDGISWSLRTSNLSAEIYCLEHNQETGSSGRFLAMTSTDVSYSSDGVTWSVAATGLSERPKALAYSSEISRWIAVLEHDGSENVGIGYSDDQGLTWTEVPAAITDSWIGTSGIENASIVSDDKGAWVVSLKDTAGDRLYGSTDNGVTWNRIFTKPDTGVCDMGVAYGMGVFVAAGESAFLYSNRALR